jgi:fermentation-respiration switch protein FrsA (DUF1100 family)
MKPARWLACAQILVLALTALVASPAQAAIKYDDIPGVVLSSSTATLPAELSTLATGKKITYVTTTVGGALTTSSGLVLTPKTGKNTKIVAWAHGTTGLADQCAPSTNQDVFWPEARAAVAELLSRGWTVAATDYPGLGTTGNHPYLVGASEGRAIIDSVKAARNLDSTLGTSYAVDGHSQGGQGALFASQLAPSYDGALVLKGTASIAPVSNADIIAPLIPGTPGQGYLVMALYGINAVEPTFNPNTYLTTKAKTESTVVQTGCLYEILDAYDDYTAEQLVPNGEVSQTVLDKLAQYGNPATTAPSAPILIVHGTADEAVPFFVTEDYLLDQLAAYSQPVTFVPLEGDSHDQAVVDSTETVADWIAARFA